MIPSSNTRAAEVSADAILGPQPMHDQRLWRCNGVRGWTHKCEAKLRVPWML
ncbi:MAG: hypothetical protein JWQ49_1434 [Edaphobacter sp.]|jgi:hypothetical protein|nr:hypothetical protein [Edaphobacter sp.]